MPQKPSRTHQGLWDLASTPIKVERLSFWLNDYPDQDITNYLLNGFQNGFKLRYTGPRIPLFLKNLKSAIMYPEIFQEKLNKELKLGHLYGPFEHPPFSNLRINPCGLVPKKSGGWRLITHLSFPPSLSINEFIDPELTSVQYSKFDSVIEMVQGLGKGALLMKKDIKSAFDLLPVYPSDFPLLGIYNDFTSEILIQKTMPQGCSLSCATFEKFSTCLHWIVANYSKSTNIDHYLDDFLFAAMTLPDLSFIVDTFDFICGDIGVPLNEDKTVGPVTTIVYLGLEIDSENGIIRIPHEKIIALIHLLEAFKDRKKITLKQLQSLVGSLNFICRAIPSGRAFNRRFYNAMSQARLPHHFIRVSAGMRSDMEVWFMFLKDFNGIYYFGDLEWTSSDNLELFTDACGNKECGCGAYFQGKWCFLKWPSDLTPEVLRDITYLELIPIMLALSVWGHLFQRKKILFRTDNNALVAIINNRSSKNNKVMNLVRQLVLFTLRYGIQFRAMHISTSKNVITDAISRLQWNRLRKVLPVGASLAPEEIPVSFLNIFKQKLIN